MERFSQKKIKMDENKFQRDTVRRGMIGYERK